jgi:hypothetical protein
MKKISSYLIDANLGHFFSRIAAVDPTQCCFRIPFTDEKQEADLRKIAADEGLSVRTMEGMIIYKKAAEEKADKKKKDNS